MADHHQINSLVFLALFSCFACSAYSYQFVVGGQNGWVVNPSENYNQWSSRMRFQVNDTLLFKYKSGADSVLVVNKDDYDKCNTANPSLKLDDGNSIFKLDRSGPFYFISGNKPNCDQGQKLIVVVLAIRTPPSPPQLPSPTAAPPKGSASSPPSPPGGSPSSPSPAGGSPSSPSPPGGSPSSPSPAGGSPLSPPSPSNGAPAPSNSPTSPTTPSGGAPSPATSPSSPSPSGGTLSPAGSGPSPAGELPESPSSSTTPRGSEAPGSSTPGTGAPAGSSTPGIGAPGSSTPGSGTPADGGNGSPPNAAAPCSASVFLVSLLGLGVFVFSP